MFALFWHLSQFRGLVDRPDYDLQSVRRVGSFFEEDSLSRVPRSFAVGATVLAAAAGLTFGLALPSMARADDPPATTVPTPTLPNPDPAPPPKPKPKPTPKPAPRPPAPRPTPTPTYTPPTTVHVTPHVTTVKPKAHARPKHKKKAVKPKPKPKPTESKTVTFVPSVSVTPPVGGVGVRNALQTRKSGGSFDLGSVLIVMGLGFAIACFAIALVPATAVKWRPAAIFVSERQVDLTVIGLGLLVAAAFTFFLTKGP
jgi:hypothetical protein